MIVASLPSRLTKVLDGTGLGVVEDFCNLLERLVGRLREEEEDVPEHGEAEHSKDDIRLPGDASERRRHEVRQRKVECPVCARAQSHSLATHSERVQLGRVGPGDRTPGWRIRSDEEISAGDDGLGRGSGHGHGLSIRVELTGLGRHRVDGKEAGVDTQPQTHEEGADEERQTTAPVVEPDQRGNCHADIDDVVDAGREQVSGANAGHVEDVDDVVHCEELVNM